MRKDYCDKCGKEIDLQHQTKDQISPHGGIFQYNLKYSFSNDLSLHGIIQKNTFNKTFDLCITCAIKMIQKIESIIIEGD